MRAAAADTKGVVETAAAVIVVTRVGAGNIVVAGIAADEMAIELWDKVSANIVAVGIGAVDMEAAWGMEGGRTFAGWGGTKDGLLVDDAACRKTGRHAACSENSWLLSC